MDHGFIETKIGRSVWKRIIKRRRYGSLWLGKRIHRILNQVWNFDSEKITMGSVRDLEVIVEVLRDFWWSLVSMNGWTVVFSILWTFRWNGCRSRQICHWTSVGFIQHKSFGRNGIYLAKIIIRHNGFFVKNYRKIGFAAARKEIWFH